MLKYLNDKYSEIERIYSQKIVMNHKLVLKIRFENEE